MPVSRGLVVEDQTGTREWLVTVLNSAFGEIDIAAYGDLAGAISLFRRAEKRGPSWADPLKFEADALSRQGKSKEAENRYALAVTKAPRWGGLRLAWG